jgi:autotransporter-associated beta strand protein
MKSLIRVKPRVAPLLAVSAAMLAGMCAHAQQISSESFSGYTTGTQVPVNTPSPSVSGYSGDWTAVDFGTGWPQTLAGSLSYSGAGYAAGTGDHIGVLNDTTGGEITEANSGRMYRLLGGALAVTASTTGTRYLSWLFQSGQETGATTYQMLDLYNGDTADAHRTFTAGLTGNGGNSGSEYDFGINEAYTSTGVAADTAVHLFVVKFDLSATAASDSVTVWIDPVLGAGEPAGGITVSAQDIAFDRLAISDYDGNSANWDEIRWGTTFDSVTIAAPPAAPSVMAEANPASDIIGDAFTVTATVTPGSGTVTNVTVNLGPIGGAAAASLVLSNGNIYTNTFTIPAGATVGSKSLQVAAQDTTPLTGTYNLAFTVVPSTYVWDGGSAIDDKWSRVTNWAGELAPGLTGSSVTFAGLTRLTPDMDANYSLAGITFSNSAGSFIIGSSTGSTLTNGINGVVNNSANAQTLNVPIVLGAAQTFNAAAGNLTLSNSITGGADLTKAGPNTLTLAGSGISSLGNLIVTNGLLRIAGGTNYVAATQGNTRFTAAGNVEVAAGGLLVITNGNNAWFPVGDTADMTNTLTLSGGTMVVSNNWGIQIGRDGSGVLNLNSGTLFVKDIGGQGFSIAEGASVTGTVNLNGGNLVVNRVRGNAGTGYFYFNGGVLKPTESRADFVPNMATVTTSVRDGGAIVDTAGFDVAITEFLDHSGVSGDNAVDGGLTKLGAGTLTLAGGFGYTGPTRVFGGTLNVDTSAGAAYPGNDLSVSNAALRLNASSGSSLYASNVVVQAGATLMVSNSSYAAAIEGAGNLTLASGTTLELDYGDLFGANPTAPAIHVTGSLIASGTNVINISGSGFVAGASFPLIDYTGSPVPTNAFVLGSLPAGVSAVLTNNADNTSLDLLITLIGNQLSWHGTDAGGTAALTNWDVNTSSNWYDAGFAAVPYRQYGGNAYGDLVTFGDSAVDLDFDGTNSVNLPVRVVPSSVTINAGTPYRLTGAGGIDGSTALKVDNATSFLLATSNNYTGGTFLNAGTLVITNDSALGASSGMLTLAGGTLQIAGDTAATRAVNVSAPSTLDVVTNVNAQLAGGITGAGGLTKNGDGTLSLSGSNSFAGNLAVNAGALNLTAGSLTLPGGGNPNFTIGSVATRAAVNVSGNATLSSPATGKFLRLGTQGGIGLLSNGPTSLVTFNTFGIGIGNTGGGSAGAIYNTGTFTNLSGTYVGNDDNTYGYIRNAGSAYFNDNVHIAHNDVTAGNGATAVMDVLAGSVFKAGAGTFWLNDQNRAYTGSGANAALNVTGGTLTFLGNSYQWNINNGANNYAAVNVTGAGRIVMTGNGGFGLGRNNTDTNSRATFTLGGGGTLEAAYGFTTAAATAPTFTFNGGTYRATAANADGLIQSGILAFVQAGGAVVDTAGFNSKIAAVLRAPTGNGVTNIILGGATSGYIGAPMVKIIGDGVGAAAIANFDPVTGTITGITVTSPGSGYTTATVTLEGGSGTPGLGATPGTATATAQLGPVSSGGLVKNGAGTLFLNATNTYTGLTVVSNGALGGTGVIAGPVLVTTSGALAPGASIGTLTISNSLDIAGNLAIEVNNTNALTSDLCIVAGSLTSSGSGTVTVTNLGPALVAGNSFTLFSRPVVNGNNLAISGGLGAGLAWTNKLAVDGSIAVVSAGSVPTTPTNLTFRVVGGTNLSLSWPDNYLGWSLQMQTNALSTGLSTNWQTIPGSSSITATNIALSPANAAVFFRMVYTNAP